MCPINPRRDNVRVPVSNEYLLAKFGFDTAENEPCQVCPRDPPVVSRRAGRRDAPHGGPPVREDRGLGG